MPKLLVQSGTIFMMPLWEASVSAGAKVFLLSDSDSAMVGDSLLTELLMR